MEDRSQILLVARALVDKGEKKGKYFWKQHTGDRIQKTVVPLKFVEDFFPRWHGHIQ
jgi:hypothetical protein